jgi:hypothetical protein
MLDQGNTADDASLSGHHDSENYPIAIVKLIADGNLDLEFKRYENGAVMLIQSDDRVYLTSVQYEQLKLFMKVETP